MMHAIRMKHAALILLGVLFFASVQVWGNIYQDGEVLEKLKRVLDELADYDYGSRAWLNDFRNIMTDIYASPEIKSEAERMMTDFLQSDASLAGKQSVCYFLSPIATGKSIPALTSLLDEKTTSEMALSAIEMIPDVSVDKILRDHLKTADDELKAWIIQSIAIRKDPKAIKLLEDHAYSADPLISSSAIDALGAIGNTQAAKTLGKLFLHLSPPLKWQVADQYLVAADHLHRSGDEKICFTIYEEVYDTDPPLSIKMAALQGMLQDPIIRAEAMFLNILITKDLRLIRATMPVLRDYPGDLDFNEFEKIYKELSAEVQKLLMIAFSERHEMAIRPLALHALDNEDLEYRMAGFLSLANIGYPEDVLTFAQKAAQASGNEKEYARKCLYELKDQQTNRIILEAIPEASTDEQVELIRSVGERNIREGVTLLLEYAHSPERSIRLEAIRSLGAIGDPVILDDLIGLLQSAPGRAERNELVKTLTLVANKKTSIAKRTDELLAAIPHIQDEETLIPMIEVLGNIGNDEALPVLRKFLYDPNTETQYATIKALSVWPNDAPVMDLKELIENSEDIKKHTLALQGYIQLLSQSASLDPDRKIHAYRQAFEIAINPEEKKMILSAVGKSGSVQGLEMAGGLLKEKDLQQEAEASFLTLLENVPDEHAEAKKKWMNEALIRTDDEDFKDRILEIMNEEN